MGLFRRKSKKEEGTVAEEETVEPFKQSKINKASYRIVVYETISGLPRKVREFIAQRTVDEEDHIPYLRYEEPKTKKVWLEIFPQQIKDFMNYTPAEIDKKIKLLNDEIKKEQGKESSKANLKDRHYQLMKLEAKKRTFQFSSDASYISLDENNMPVIFYKREGSNYLPFKWDIKSDWIFIPSDNKKKSAAIALRNKEAKYPSRENQVRIATMVTFIVAALLAMGAGYLFYEAGKTYADNEINEIKEQQLKDIQAIQNMFKVQGQTMQTILSNMSANVIVTGGATTRSDSETVDFGNE